MDSISFWTAFTILTSASGGGFLFLINQINKNHLRIDSMKIEIQNKPTYKEVSDDYAKKEIIELKFLQMEKNIELILEKLEKLTKNG